MKRQLTKGMRLLFSDVQSIDNTLFLFFGIGAVLYLIGFGA